MSNNIIYNDKDETIGYYSELYKLYEEEITEAIKSHALENAKQYLDEVEDIVRENNELFEVYARGL